MTDLSIDFRTFSMIELHVAKATRGYVPFGVDLSCCWQTLLPLDIVTYSFFLNLKDLLTI
jgi:hypothetical protein